MAENRRICASCGTPNEEDARFCEGCGGSLARICATCGVEANATARFCRGCGAPLDGQVTKAPNNPAAGPARKTVTVMFADLAGSTSFEERVDVETAREVIGRYHNLLRSIAERHRAGFTKYIGDGFMAVWGVPEIGPDDAAHAVDAAVALQERFVELATGFADTHGVELALRVAVNTGEVVVGAGDADLVGDALNVGARLEAECPRGHVVVGEETWRSTRGRYRYESLGDVQVKGRTAPVAVYQWLGRQSAAEAAPFVGRADEVRRLQAVFDDAVAARAARVVTVIGDPGVGKSRLAAEFTGARAGTHVIEARCDVEGTAALAPIVEMLRSRDLETDVPATVPERDRLLRDLNGLTTGVPGSVEENFWALRRFVEVLASNEPVLLILDDIQWADSLLLDFLEHLVEWVQEVPVLVLALARPELREMRPDLVTVSRWVSEAVHLDGLDAGATAELAAKVLGATRLPDELLRRLPSSTGGNPLFVRELIGMLAHDGVLVSEPAGWRLTIDADAIAIPPTIHALLASRLERLDAADRRVLEIASVVGSDFSLGAVSALAGSDSAGVSLSLNRLRRLELAQPSGVYVGDEPVWRFHHVLIRDVAYRRLLKSDRADLHERLADWVVVGGPSVAFDSDETAARHLEAAHAYRVELGAQSDDLALRSARHYAASARRALDRDELISAGTQAARGAALAADDEAVHAELLVIGCEAFLSAGDVAACAALVDELERVADEALAPWATCYRCQFIVYTAPERLLEVDARLQGAIDEFGRRADPAGLAKAHRVRASARARLGRIGDCEVDLFEALIAARKSQDHRQITAALGAAPAAALWGPSPVPKAGGRCLDVVRMQRMTTAAPSLEATSLRCLAVLELLRGRPDKARTMLADARQIVADLGLRHGLMETELFAGIIESMEGDPVAAEPHFRTALEGLDALGVGADAGQAAALLARSVLAQGRVDEADRYAAESERLAGRNLKSAIAWRAVRAEILAAQGRNDDAAAMAREAVAVAAETDLVLDHADACLTLSRVLAAAGDAKGANTARDDADRLYAAKEVAAAIGRTAEPAPSALSTPSAAEAAPTASRLAVTNQSCDYLPTFIAATRAHDVDGALAWFADEFVYDDHRRISGDPVRGREAMRDAIDRVFAQYTKFDFRVLAVRGQRSHLLWNRWSDDDGNQTTTFYVNETDDDGLVGYHGRFDEADFESAYRELDRRYYAGEGAAFAEHGIATSEAAIALDLNEFDRFFGEFCSPDLHVENRSRSALPDRSATDLLTSFTDLNTLVARSRTWMSVVRWLSPTWSVNRLEREAVGQDGEEYAWTRILVCEQYDGRFTSVCEFDTEDEEAVFAYAEERMRATDSRVAVTNRASRTMGALTKAMLARDFDGAIGCYADPFVYDDRRRISGDPIRDNATMRRGFERIAMQYNDFDARALAVRGERLHLALGCFSNDDGFETTYLFLHEVGDDGRITYEARFDEDDFDGAYRELERRYYAGEGAAFAGAWPLSTEWVIALNQGDFDKVFGELSTADMHIENRSRSAFPDRSAAEVRAGLDELNAMVASARTWNSLIHWLSPTCSVVRQEREAVGRDGERYAWVRLVVGEVQDGRIASSCVFDLEDENSAFAYAEERVRAKTSRLAVTNRATRAADVSLRAMQAHDAHGAVATLSDRFVYDDRRRLTGDPIQGADELQAAVARILEHYPNVEWRTLAVRGARLELRWTRWWDDDGNEATYLTVFEVGDDGLIEYHGRFDGDDFEGAYRELDRRYYAGEGAAFAEAGAVTTDWIIALNHGDYDRLFGELTTPDMRVKSRSSSVFGDRTATEIRRTFEELDAMVSSARAWEAVVHWLSPAHVVLRFEREAVGRDGETFAWTWVDVCQIRNGRVVETCRFDLEDEEAAFAYAEEWAWSTASRLPITNRASDLTDAVAKAMHVGDIDTVVGCYADPYVYDDRRRISGDPIHNIAELRAASERVLEQYNQFDTLTLAVRGDRLHLFRNRFTNEAGYETTYLFLYELGDDGRFHYEGRFDEDDFEGAYRELERRFYAGEGAAYAEAGAVGVEWVTALNRGDFDRVFNELTEPGMRVENRSLSVFGDPTAAELRATFEELNQMVASARAWSSAVCWLSPECGVARFEREAVGLDGEKYAWARLQAVEIRNGRLASLCRFEVDDEEAAFAYAEERVRATASRLPVTNRARETSFALVRALQSGDVDDVMACFSDRFVYDDRRRLGGNPLDDLRTAMTRILVQYSHFESRTLAVRGDRLHLLSSRWSDDAGNETTHLHVQEIDDDGRMTYEGRFDEDDLVGAYRVLDERYYADEGRAFAEAGAVSTNYAVAVNQSDFDRLIGELTAPDFRFENRSPSVFPDRTAAQLRATMEELNAMVASTRTWLSAVCWVSPTVCISLNEREAVGHDGEQFTWTRLYVIEIRDGRFAGICQFDPEDEDAAFGYAEERARAAASRLAVVNLASRTYESMWKAMEARDVDGAVAHYAESIVYDDRRRLGGNPLEDLRAATERIFDQYSLFDGRTLAVRGDRLHLSWTRWSNEAGFESCYLMLQEVDEGGRVVYHGRFDEDDFEGAYRELETRYYAGEGAAFAESGAIGTDWMIALNRGDFDRLFGELTSPDLRVENRSRSVFPHRSAAELRTTYEELYAMVASARTWNPVQCFLSPTWSVIRQQREAVGLDGEQFAWTGIYACECRDGRLASLCQFDVEDEEAAFAYAEERANANTSRLAVTNLASRTCDAGWRAMQARDLDAVAACYAASFVYDDRRRLGGNPIDDLGTAQRRILEQYNQFEYRTLAVRGERLHLGWTRWSNDAGYETTYLLVHEIDESGRFVYEGRFDEDDFEGAYRGLEARYYAGEGAAFAEAGAVGRDFAMALNRGDYDRAFGELSTPDMRVDNRSRTAFPDRSASEFRATDEELNAMVASARVWDSAMSWLSPTLVVGRFEREAVGRDGERYLWTGIHVAEVRNGRMGLVCLFDIEDEHAAFAYAEERAKANTSRLAVTNRAKRTMDEVDRTSQARDFDRAAAWYSPTLVYDDRRRLSGHPIGDMRTAIGRIAEQYTSYEFASLAVRGDRLHLGWTRWSNDSGFVSSSLWVHEVDDDGIVIYQARFDEDDFEDAYRELTQRYCADEGAAFAEIATLGAEWMIAMNEGDFDRAFNELTAREARVENRSSSAFPDRSAAELRASLEDLNTMVTSVRSWNSVERWLSSTCGVVRHEREAVGQDGEQFAWTRVYVFEARDGRCVGWCEFELDDEAAAFTYAKERANVEP